MSIPSTSCPPWEELTERLYGATITALRADGGQWRQYLSGNMNSSSTGATMATKSLSIEQFLASLATKNPTPGGGAAAAIGASVGSAAASMAAAYTQRKKDVESGAAEQARALIATLEVTTLLQAADDDAVAYSDLQRTWNKELEISADEKTAIEARALAIPTTILEDCHSRIHQIYDFLPHCNPNITSDAKVGIHQLAGAARAAYQTVLVNSPTEEEKTRLVKLLIEIKDKEEKILNLDC